MSKSRILKPVKENFRFSTLNFIFIIAYVNIFQMIFGPENSIVGVIFTIMMSASMVRDLTATPLKHFFIQAAVLVWMAVSAYAVTTCSAPLSLCINFATLLGILYAFTYEYASNMYFPYILSYLFLIFLSPVTADQLPKRILAMLAGAVSIMLYQWFMGRKRVKETARDVLSGMIDEISLFISSRQKKEDMPSGLTDMRRKLCLLSQTVYDRRKKVLCISDASFSMIDAGRGLEHLLILLTELPDDLSADEQNLLTHISSELKHFRSFLHQETDGIPPVQDDSFLNENPEASLLFQNTLQYIRDRLLHMTDPQNKGNYRKTALSLKIQLQAALDISPVRITYALRTALLLSLATLLVQSLGLPHGKWLLFTLASVSLPYADDVPSKIKKRLLATVMGGLVSVAVYSLVPSAAGRTAAMMLSGYLSFYFADYAGTFACSTIGALGGAVFLDTFGLPAVSSIFLIRLGYILAGAMIAFMLNCLFCPYSRARATRQLWKKYKSITDLLTQVAQAEQIDVQLYYNLVIQAHLQEARLVENAALEKWKELPAMLSKCQKQIRTAARQHITGREDAPVLETRELV